MIGLIEARDILEFVLEHQYLAMFAVLFLCGCGLPIPEEIPLIASGIVVGLGKADFWLASATCVCAILVGDSVIFFAGRFAGRKFPESRFIRFINNPKITGFFTKHGKKTVFFARFFAGVRMGVYAYAGQHGLSWIRFIFLDLLGALISGPTSVWLGKYAVTRLGDSPEAAMEHAQQIFHDNRPWFLLALGLLIAFVVTFAVWKTRCLRKQYKASQESSEAPAAEAESVPTTTTPDTIDREARRGE